MTNQVFGELQIKIFNTEGKAILKIKFEKNTEHFLTRVDLSGQAKGMYLINFILDKYKTTRKLAVE